MGRRRTPSLFEGGTWYLMRLRPSRLRTSSNPKILNQRGPLQTKRAPSCLAGGEGLLGSELLQFCQNAAHEHAMGEGEAWLAPGAGRG